MEIRQLVSADAYLLQKIRLEGLKNAPTSFGSSFAEESQYNISVYEGRIQSKTNHFYGAFVDAEIVGVICLSTNSREKMIHRASIKSVYVSIPHRRKGIAKHLITRVIQRAIELNVVEQIELTVTTSQRVATSLYMECGFEVYGTKSHAIKYNDEYYSEYLMMKKLY